MSRTPLPFLVLWIAFAGGVSCVEVDPMVPQTRENPPETQGPRPDVGPEPEGVGETPPCGATDQIPADVIWSVDATRRVPQVDLPEVPGAAAWRLDFVLHYGGERVAWRETALPGESVTVVLPDDAYVDALQDSWLSEVMVRAVPRTAEGIDLGVVSLPRQWVLWDQGPQSPPRWFDRDQFDRETLLGASSPTARAHVAAAMARRPVAPTEFIAPRSTP